MSNSPTTSPTASMWFATSYAGVCSGPLPCHYCGAPCSRLWNHDDLDPVPFIKSRNYAKHLGSPYMCHGCMLFKKTRLTVQFMVSGQYKDSQSPARHSWLITPTASYALRPEDKGALYRKLLMPPNQFTLALYGSGGKGNEVHRMEVNCVSGKVEVGTELKFTLNNQSLSYSPYELEQCLRNGPGGVESGVIALVGYLGPYTLPVLPEVENKMGRPPALTDARELKTPVK